MNLCFLLLLLMLVLLLVLVLFHPEVLAEGKDTWTGIIKWTDCICNERTGRKRVREARGCEREKREGRDRNRGEGKRKRGTSLTEEQGKKVKSEKWITINLVAMYKWMSVSEWIWVNEWTREKESGASASSEWYYIATWIINGPLETNVK